ncbi:uncharacterized protein [Musca autumnalis]|uniref:uncharacterized protein n=1 Tax=Musca autumnalis TaxID=221902 RepID=UPI003CF8614A
MIYTRVKFTTCFLVVVISALALAEPSISLREKLAKLLMDPEFDNLDNEISREDSRMLPKTPFVRQGMLLKNPAPEIISRFKNRKNSFSLFDMTKSGNSESYESEENTKTETKITTTTTEAPDAGRNVVLVGMAPLKALMNRLMEMWSG